MTREMKDSGIEWIGEIPEDWDVSCLKYFLEVPMKYGANETGIPFDKDLPRYIRITDINLNGELKEENKLSLPCDIAKAYILKNNTVLFARSGATVGKTFLYEEKKHGKAAFAGYLISAQTNKNMLGKWLLYFTNSSIYWDWINSIFTQATIQNVSAEKYANMAITIPSLLEQQKIVDFLDQQCAEIDSVIAHTRTSIEEYKKLKQSVITQAVTKGLNPNVEMKDSGIEWIGEIPKNWKRTKTLNCLSMPITDGPHTTPTLYSSGIPFISAEAVSKGNGSIDFDHMRGYISKEFYEECSKKYVPQKNDIYMIKSGATTGKVAVVDTDAIFTIWSPLAVFRTNKGLMFFKYLFYFLQSDFYQKQVELNWTYGTQQNIGMRTLETLKILLPPLSEQQQIADYLDNKCTEIDTLITKKEQFITEMEAYKKSLIYEYVTGKKEVI